jgi:hypothetical protein
LSLHVLDEGSEALTAVEQRDLLSDRRSLIKLHTLIWAQSSGSGNEVLSS